MPIISPQQAIQKAYTALQGGDRRTAHHWAAYAAQAAPELEDAWLMLAACSGPRASIAYLKRALQINPASQRARQGIHWARKRLGATSPSPKKNVSPVAKSVPQKSSRSFWWIGALFVLLVLTVPLALIAFQHFPARADSPGPVAAELWDDSTLKPPQATPTLDSVPVASPTPELVSPTPTESVTVASPATVTESVLPTEAAPVAAQTLETATQPPRPTATLAFEPEPSPGPESTPETESTPFVHVIQPEETLQDLAIWYGVEVAAILSLNGFESAEQVPPGFELLIPPAEYIAPPPSYSREKSILVSISQQHLWAYEGDQEVYSFVASTGMGNSTRVGSFEVLNKIPSAYGATWNIWMPSWMGIYWSGSLQNGIHALPILPGGGILWEGYLGTPISYGCVVLGTYEAQLLYDWAEIGTTVNIQW